MSSDQTGTSQDSSGRGYTTDFAQVKGFEEAEITKRRETAKVDDDPNERVGLALSGGGVRSASFNLGLIQALQSCGLMPHVDYLSTVSGGSYVGATLSTQRD